MFLRSRVCSGFGAVDRDYSIIALKWGSSGACGGRRGIQFQFDVRLGDDVNNLKTWGWFTSWFWGGEVVAPAVPWGFVSLDCGLERPQGLHKHLIIVIVAIVVG